MADASAESYPRLRELLGEDGFKELARLIRTTYEANEHRRRREASTPPAESNEEDDQMAELLSLVRGVIPAERSQEVRDRYREALEHGSPPAIEETFLLETDAGEMAIASVWRRREDLDALLGSGEEPFARRLIRSAGGDPQVTIYNIVERAGPTRA
jgi:hypothetical protein